VDSPRSSSSSSSSRVFHRMFFAHCTTTRIALS
jgi:hypothetical protein